MDDKEITELKQLIKEMSDKAQEALGLRKTLVEIEDEMAEIREEIARRTES
jgi:hypothetical protein